MAVIWGGLWGTILMLVREKGLDGWRWFLRHPHLGAATADVKRPRKPSGWDPTVKKPGHFAGLACPHA